MIIVYINDALLGVYSGECDDCALEWIQAQVDLNIQGEITQEEEGAIYFIGETKVELIYEEYAYRLDIN